MKKILLSLFILLGTIFIFGTNARAAEDSRVNIKSITLKEKSDTAELLSEPSADGLGINSNIKFLLVGDYVTYKVVFENKDSVDYEINLNSGNDYFKYTLDNNVVKANGETELLLTIKYDKVVPQSMLSNNQLNQQSVVSGALTKTNESTVADSSVTITAKEINNPKTADNIGRTIIFAALSGAAIISFIFVKSAKKRMLVLTMFAVSILCVRANANDTIMLNINSKIFVQSGLVYNGEVVHKSSIEDKANYTLSEILGRYCNEPIDMEIPEQHFGNTYIEPISENAGIFTIRGYLTDDLDIGLSMTVKNSIDPESGDSERLVYDYNYNSSVLDGIDYTKLIYNNELLDRKGLEEIIESDSLKIGNSLSNIDYDCAKRIFAEPLFNP